jgi:glycerophosphoryl diester phosphodiesterase
MQFETYLERVTMRVMPLRRRSWIPALLLAAACVPAHALDLQGHRGARGLAPENTLPAFALALGLGVTTLKLDIAITRDDVLVISHDSALNPDITRGPDGRFLEARGPVIRDLGYAELQRLREAGMAARSTVASFDWRTLAVVQRQAPEIGTAYLTAQQPFLDNIGAGRPEGSAWTNGIQFKDHGSVAKMIHAAGGRIWSAFHGDLDAAKVEEAHSLGLQVLAWTVNSPADIARALDLGVDGLVSDRPDVVRQEMQRRGLALPVASPVQP